MSTSGVYMIMLRTLNHKWIHAKLDRLTDEGQSYGLKESFIHHLDLV